MIFKLMTWKAWKSFEWRMAKQVALSMTLGLKVELLQKRIDVLNGAIEWALGERGNFTNRMEGDGAYWWRKELRMRAAIGTPAAVKFPPAAIFTRVLGLMAARGGDPDGRNREQANDAEKGQGPRQEGLLK